MSPSRRLYRNRFGARDVVMPEANASIAPDTAPRMHVIGRRLAALSLLATALGMTGLAQASGGPTGGQIVGGSGQIQQVGNTTTIRQNSQTLSLNWQSFDIAPNQTVNFLQPGSGAIAINRIFSSTPSEIFGHLNANGQVWLINPNGILFGQGAQVNVGGLVASTLDFDDSTLDSSNRRFSGNGKGSIINRGSLTAGNGGYIALLGNQVSNQGVVTAQLGTVAMGGGSAVTLTFSGNQVVHLEVDRSTLNNLVENRQLVVADGGRVIMTAGAKDSLLASVVNNTGVVQAQTVQNHNGEITLLGGMTAGQVNVGGTLDASAPKGGNGGFIETSGAQAHIADGSVITTKAVGGKDGTWLVDPTDFTIAASGGDITATTLETDLAAGNISFASSNGASGTSGNVNVNAPVTWSANTTLTLTASNNINLGAVIKNTGTSGKTVLNAGNAFVNNVGAGGLVGNWAIYSASPTATGENLGGLVPGFIQYNAPIGTAAVAGATGNGVFYAVAPTLNVTGLTGTVQKNYDGTASATLADNNFTYTGLLNGDKIGSAAGTYSQSDVGTGLTVTSSASISGFNIVNPITVNGTQVQVPVYGYALSGGSKTASIGQIMAAQLYATIIGDPTKVYDGTTTATLTSGNYYITGLAAGQSITVNQPSSVGYASADVNTNGGTTPNGGKVAVDATFTSTNFIAGSGTKLSNYILPTATSITSAALAQDATAGYGVITPAPVQLSGVLTTNKTYDQTTHDTLDTSNASIFGVVGNDHVTLDKSNAAGIFASANAGNNIAVTLSGFALVDTVDPNGATKVADYQLIAPTNLTANIAPYVLTVSGITANGKSYDGTTADTLNTNSAQLSAALSGDVVHLTGTATGTFSQADAGTGLAVAVNGLSVDNSNYTVNAPTGLTANITPRLLNIQFSGSADKIYDGTDYATLSTGNFTVSNVVAGQTVSVNQAPAIYSGASAPNVGTDTVTATLQSSDLNFANGAKTGNYTFNTSVVGSGHITPAPLTLTINGNPTRTYDGAGDTSATLSGVSYTLSGVIPGESITVNGPATGNYYDTANGAAPGPGSYEGNAGTWGVVAALSSGNYTANGSTLLSNYSLPTLALGYGTITPAHVGIYLVTDVNGSKVYDGTNTLTIAPGSSTNYLVLGGLQGTDQATLTSSVTGTFASNNVGSQPLTVANLVATDFTFTSGSASNYTFPESVTGTGSIIAKDLYITLNGVTKQYDGNTTVLPLSNSNFTVYGYVNNNTSGTQDSGWVSGQGATITPTASFTYQSPNVVRDGSGNVLSNRIGVTGTLTQNNYAANGGTLLTNYNLVYNVSGMGTITPAPLYVTGVYAQNKVYDTTNAATVNIVNGQLAGLAGVDKNNSAITLTIGTTTTGSIAGNGAVTGSTVSGTFATSDAGNGQTVSTVFSLGGSSAGNYNLVVPALAANITPAPLTISGIVTNNKVYDGTTTATFGAGNSFTFDTQSATLNGFVGADNANDVMLSAMGTTGTFSTANVGSNLSVTGVNGFSLSAGTGGDKSNDYYVVQPTGLTASITKRQLNVTITGNPTKVYDGSNSATLTAGDYTITGWVSGQGATLPQSATANYRSADVMGLNGSTVDSTLVSSDWKVDNSSTLLSNYNLPTSATGTGTITPYVLNLSATRVYDATTNIYSSLSGNVTNADNANVFGTLAGLNGDQFTVSGTGATSSKNVGTYTGSAFNLGSLALVNAGSNSGTEKTSNYTLVGGVDSYSITPAPLNITGASVTTKVYDGNTVATVTGATLTSGNAAGDVLGTDDVQISNGNIAGTFNNKNAGTGKTVTINAADITGGDAGNYAIVQPAGLAGTINQRPVTISGKRAYDGQTTVTGNSGAITWAAPGTVSGNANSGVVSGDTVTVNGGTGSLALADVGTYNSDGSGSGTFTATGLTLSNGNYAISTTGNQFQVTPFIINFTGSSTYTGNSTVSVSAGNFFNGTNAVSSAGAFNTGIGTETLTLNGPYTLANSGNAGTNVTSVNASSGAGLSFTSGSGNASDYEIGKVTYTVNPYVLSFSGSRTYDGTTNVNAGDLRDATAGSGTLGTATFTGLNGDTFTVSGTGSLSSANKGNYGGNASGTSSAPGSSTQIGVNGLTLIGTGTSTGTDLASNYTFVGGNDTYDINAKLVTITGTRQYNTGTNASGGQAGTTWQVIGVTGGDASNLSVIGTGSVSSANVGTYGDNGTTGANVFNSNVGAGGLSLSGSAAGNYTLATTGNTFVINPYVLSLSGSRAYDSTTSASASLFGNNGTLTGVNGETLTLSGTGTVSSANANTNPYTGTGSTSGSQGFNLNTLTLGNGSGAASNYTLIGGNDSLTINKAVVNLSGTRQYDAGTDANASAFGSNGVIDTGVNGEKLALSGAGSVGGSDVGNYTGANFNAGSLALGNNTGLASNYTLTGGSDSFAITPYVLNLSGTRQYDAGTDASASAFGSNGTINTGVGGQTLVVTGLGSVNGTNVGNYTQASAAFNTGTLALNDGSGHASNYVLGSNGTFAITPYVLDLSGSRAYDSTTSASASLFGNNGTLTGVNGETLTLSGTGTVSSANANTNPYTGTGSTSGSQGFNLNTLTLGNGSGAASNYTLIGGNDSLTINKAVVNLSGTRQYDAGTDANASAFGSNGVIDTGVNGEKLALSGAGSVGGSDVGNYTGANFNAGSLALGNNTGLASNYTLTGGSDSFAITPYVLNLSGTRQYDAGTDASASAFGSNGTINTGVGGQTLVVTGLGSVNGTNVGNYTQASAAFNTGTLALNDGSGHASNYVLGSNGTFAITPHVLDLSGSRAYDSTTSASASLFGNNGTLTGVNGETLTLSGTGTVSSANANTNPYTGTGSLSGSQGFNLSTLTLGNGSGTASNYTLIGGNDSLTINKAVVNLSGTRQYDAGTDANASAFGNNGVVNTGVGSETLTLTGTGSVTGADVGNYGGANFNAGSLTLGDNSGLASNYTLTGGNDSFAITPHILSLNGSRAYDSTTDACACLFGNNGVLTGVNGETLTLSGTGIVSSANANANPYTGVGAAGGSQGFNLNTLTLGNGSGAASNYTLIGGNDSLTINRAVVNISGTRQYDAGTDASASAFGNGGVIDTGVNGEKLALSGVGSVTGANVGNYAGANVNIGSLTLGDNTGLASNYTLTGGNDSFAITPYVLGLNGSRAYDGSTAANASLFGSNGTLTGVNGETLTLSGTGTVASANANTTPYTGTGSAGGSQGFNLNTLTLGNGSGAASNYTLIGGTDSLTINKAVINLSGTRQYDAGTDANASAFGNNGVINTGVGSETLSLTGAGSVTGANVGNYAGANFSTGTLALNNGSGSASNYTLTGGNDNLAITPYVLNLTGTRVYDGMTDANANLFGNGVLTGVNGETVDLSGSGVLNSKHVGTQSFANLGTLALSDGSGAASNYTLVGGIDKVTVTPLAITVSATGQGKTYDGNTTASVTLSTNGVLPGDTLSFGDGASNFVSPNAGSNVSITVTGITATGSNVGDYSFNTTATTSATISPYVLNLTSTRVYDGTTGADASLFGNNGVISTGVNGETVDLGGSGVLTSKNVGSQRAFANLGSLVLGNGTGLATNYTLAGGTDWVSITPATVTVIGTTTTNRVYDGTRIDALNGSTLSGVFGNDDVVLGNDSTGLFGDKNVGNGKAVSTAMTISGGDASNYILLQPMGLTANVTPLAITVTATGTNRQFNGKTGDVVSLSTSGVLAGDQVSVADISADFADPYVGNGKTVTVSGITASGADAGNYVITDPVTTTTANITSAGFDGTGVQGSWIAQLQAGLQPAGIATPYGSSDDDAVGVFTGNQKMKHKPVERNRARSDFRAGLSLQFQNGGVRLPSDASP